ncbi:hypothetical protein GCM10028784_08970 [Myceligenerans cantabricum]
MNTPEHRQDPFVRDLARVAGELTPVVDGRLMAGTAIRKEKQRRALIAVAACVAALTAVSAAIGAAGTVRADKQNPLPASTVSQRAVSDGPSAGARPSSDPSSPPDGGPDQPDTVHYLRTGGGELPELPGVEHGVTGEGQGGAAPYLFGGLWYEVPPGGWSAIGDVTAGGKIGWARPDSEDAWAGSAGGTDGALSMSIDDVVVDLELRKVTEVAGWSVPPKDSGATTLEIEGADLVVIEQGKVVTEQRAGEEIDVRPVETRIRSGGEGWIIESRFTADDAGDEMLRNFLGNLWLQDHGEPDWYRPAFTNPEIGEITHETPDGWDEAAIGGLSYAYPADWSAGDPEPGTFADLVEISSDEVVAGEPGLEDPEVRWNGYVESGDPGPNFWPGWVDMSLKGMHEIEVPGADYAVVQVTEGPFYGDKSLRSLSGEVNLHQAGDGNHASIDFNFPGGDDGLRLLRQFLGGLSYER